VTSSDAAAAANDDDDDDDDDETDADWSHSQSTSARYQSDNNVLVSR